MINIFIDGIELPTPLPKNEIYELFEKVKLGDNSAREKIIIHNIRRVLNEVQKKFYNTAFDNEELVAVGLIGLTKSVDKFDSSKGIEFATFSCTVIDNEIRMYMRKENKHYGVASLNDEDENELALEERIFDKKVNIEEDYIYNEQLTECKKYLEILSERERKIVMLYFGFYNDNRYSQKEIAEMLSLSQSLVSKEIVKSINKLKKHYEYKQKIFKFLVNKK